MYFSTLKGFFFYYAFVRKDLLNKMHFLIPENIVNLDKVQFRFTTNQKYKTLGSNQLFALLAVLEFLTNTKVEVLKCDEVKIDHFNRLKNLQIVSLVNSLDVYEIFLRSYFLWYRGLPHTSEEFSILPGMPYSSGGHGSGLKRNSRTGKGSVDYIRYKDPIYVVKAQKTSFSRLTAWPDFTFCAFIPINVTGACMSLKGLLTFNTQNEIYIKALLSALRIFHRFKVVKK